MTTKHTEPLPTPRRAEFYASANSRAGFVGFFPELFSADRLQRLFILKGGPGTGKSTFMRAVADSVESYARARALQIDTTLYYCSSDIASLDGVALTNTATGAGVAVIDGTAPHTADPQYPGAFDCIVNLGEHWDDEKLAAHLLPIRTLCAGKAQCFKNSYRMLEAAAQAEDCVRTMYSRGLLYEKMQDSAARFALKYLKAGEEGGFRLLSEYITSISAAGVHRLDAVISRAPRIIAIRDRYMLGHQYLDLIIRHARALNQPVIRFPSPLDIKITEGVLFEATGELFITDATGPLPSERVFKTINMERFVDHELAAQCRQRVRFFKKCSAELLEGAVQQFAEAKELHARLEQIYTSCMDFEGEQRRREEIVGKIIGLLFG